VDDAAARTFATTFYEALLDGYRFMDAVAAARVRSREQHGGVTWAAYQCYGDPDWRLRRDEADAQAPTGGLAVGPATRRDETEGVISRVGLLHVLEATEVQARLAAGERVAEERERLRARLRTLQTRFGELWGAHGAVAEAFGHAWKEAGDRDEAMRWYERAMRAEDGTATLRAPEQLANLRVRAAWRAVERVRGEEEARAAALQARAEILTALERLETLVTMEATMERESLRGSAEKRLAMIARRLNEPEAELGHIDLMAEHYRKARERGEAQGLSDEHYPAGNSAAAEVTMHGGEAGFAERIAPELARARELLAARAQEEPDFWSVVGLTELRWMEAVAAGALAPALAGLAAEFEMHHARSTAPGNWASVHEQAEFVLGPYAMRAGADERAAVDELLGQLAEFAGLGARGGRR
jgi:hypothetical protein